MMSPRAAGWVGIVVGFAAVFFLIGMSANSGFANWVAKAKIPFDHASTVATVTQVNNSNHGTCAFSFTASGRQYFGSDHSCGNRGPGDELSVNYYTPSPQTLSSASSPTTLCAEALGIPIGGAVIFAFGIWATLRKTHRV